jgi:(2S)-methylsuccinyl-CoA dehydrogenase
VPEEIISGLAELGGFGLSVPEEYDGFATGGESDYMGMVVATEELSRGLARHRRVTRHPPRDPHARLVAGGTEEQKRAWLPRIASGDVMVGIMVTEPTTAPTSRA